MSVGMVQKILADQHIVVKDVPPEELGLKDGPIAFDEAGLRLLRNLESPIKFQGKPVELFILWNNKSMG